MSFELYNTITAYGDQIPLAISIKYEKVLDKLQSFDNDWTQYNPRKLPNNRHGLSITNLDGKLGAGPDLDSLIQYNKEHGTTIRELDFIRINKDIKVIY